MDLGNAKAILDSAQHGFISMDADGRVAYWNPRAAEMFGWAAHEALGRPLTELIIPERFRGAHTDGIRRFLQTGEARMVGRTLELQALRREQGEFPVELTVTAIQDHGEWSFHAFVVDISERRAAEHERSMLLARLEAQARTDELTGLPNRRAWGEELRRELARAQRRGSTLSVMMLDLDHFKDYNDTHGHQAGDRLLREAAAGWRSTLRLTDMIARYGGEEFAVLLPECPPRNASEIVARMTACTPAGQTLSAGIAVWDGVEPADALMGRADQALYEAKRSGRNRSVEARARD
jgi:diguanylate cyclase (GGDEF)-like protein/PAS domain S-box-containing protein